MRESFGILPDGREAELFTLQNSRICAQITNYGATLARLVLPDKNGDRENVVLGYRDAAGYYENSAYFGATIGRNCNRIAGATITIQGQEYCLPQNNGKHNLHGGPHGLSYRLWEALAYSAQELTLTTEIADGEDGFPGNLEVTVTFRLFDEMLLICYTAHANKTTVINLTNHSYFNLAGQGTIHDHLLHLDAPLVCIHDQDVVPTGEIICTNRTDFDFAVPRHLRQALESSDQRIRCFSGLDHNFLLTNYHYQRIGSLHDPVSGRSMEVFTDRPCVQIYTANALTEDQKQLQPYGRHSGICFETQDFPNAAAFPWLRSSIVPSGATSRSQTGYKFR